MKEVIVLVGAPGSGKSTYCKNHLKEYYRINQDDLGRDEQWFYFEQALLDALPLIVIDRMNFNKEFRSKYIIPAREKGYKIKIINFSQVPFETCLKRTIERDNHPTIERGDATTARKAIGNFFKRYEDIQPDEADEIVFVNE